ncbi:Twinfilin-1 [Knufia fluminis]|uniref:Twinfilin-1 n=1 Tax=Knufia fluminis TaxID=191047 RepID=A0AAN8EIP7_9EURO|nr:Twinfilin-1 [Knufia fluminis]
MQSGITASTELTEAFNAFTLDSSLFALPITITGESLQPQSAIPFTSSDFNVSLSSLQEHLQPKTPIYLILRPSPQQNNGLIAITYVPSTAPVRQKMLFASTRNTLIRDLGLEKFGDNVFVTDAEEVLDPRQWETRGKGDKSDAGRSQDILSTEERELQGVKRAEEEERHGTSGRDLMGEGGSGGGRLAMKITGDAKEALGSLAREGAFVQLGIEIASETLGLVAREGGVSPSQFLGSIPGDRPTYSFYRYPGTEGEEVVFLYTCPGGSKVKERMVYASARASVLQAAKGEGVNVTRRLEQGDNDEVGEQRLKDEVGISVGEGGNAAPTSRQGFAKPKRPGKR